MARKSVIGFILKSAVYWIIPMAVMVIFFITADPLRVLRWHSDFMEGGFLPNKGSVTVKQFNHQKMDKKYDSFIIGSSITINHWIDDWKEHLPAGANPYHFDFSEMSPENVARSLEYLSKQTEIKNVLYLLEPYVLERNDEGFILPYSTPPDIHPNLFYRIYLTYRFFNSFYRQSVLSALISGYFFHTNPEGVFHIFWHKSIEYYNGNINEERALKEDSRLDSLYDISLSNNYGWENNHAEISGKFEPIRMNDDFKSYFDRIADVLNNYNINYYVVMAPSRLNRMITPSDEAYFYELFGDRFINLYFERETLSNNDYLWYTWDHYRPRIAKEIMNRIYNEK